MLSDSWLNFVKSATTWVSDIVHYHYWYNKEEPVGISISFDYADDFHYDISLEEWKKSLDLFQISEDLKNTKACLSNFFRTHKGKFDFEVASKGICSDNLIIV